MSEPYKNPSPSLGTHLNAYGQPIGKALPDWRGCVKLPDDIPAGRTCRVTLYDAAHTRDLCDAFAPDDGRMWTYLPDGPFTTPEHLHDITENRIKNKNFHTFSILSHETERPVGQASFMRYDMPNGSVEVGAVTYSPALRRSTVATEAMYLMMKHAFDHGYRRYEWKCDQLNAASNEAALRLGFQFEGVFRNATIYRGRRRDTAWYSVIAEDWPQVRARLEAWLDPANFDSNGVQKQALSKKPLKG